MKGAPFFRLKDKISFIVGVLLLVFFCYYVGRHPNTHYYIFSIIVVIVLVFMRVLHYKKMNWHYYLFDFCYFANALVIYFLLFDPKNDGLFKCVFMWANGPLGFAIAAFRNSLIFHKFDNLTSCAIHVIPMVTSWNLKWTTMPYEATLPES